ncbi:hypothetical protein BMS3Bbin11_01578 [bacterium BMS3Bbin11]|nr:hypothetical protein BMS3Bbin11_01578 [bacterium BMS3Bbin11]
MPALTNDFVMCRVTHQAGVITHFVHHIIAGVDTGSAGYALVLQAIPNIDAGWTGLYAQATVYAVTFVCGFFFAAFACPARISPYFIIGNNQGVIIKHDALKACVRTHIDTYLFP